MGDYLNNLNWFVFYYVNGFEGGIFYLRVVFWFLLFEVILLNVFYFVFYKFDSSGFLKGIDFYLVF